MVRARSAFAFALLLSGAVLLKAQSDESPKSLESWEIDEIEKENAASSTAPTTTTEQSSLESWEMEEEEKSEKSTSAKPTAASIEQTQTTGKKSLRGFVTPRPFVVEHPLFSSTWAAWSAWSFCVNNVRIRVRACNTVRGFSCVGKNQETEPCANSLYHHHPARPQSHSDYDVVDPYEDDRIEALKQLYPDENPSDVLERRRPNPNFLRIGTTGAPRKASSEVRRPTSIEKAEEIEEKETEKAAEAGQQPETDFKKAKGAKTETQEVPLQAEIEGALEKLEVHRDSETRRQHSASYHTLNQKAPYAHDGSMGTGYTLIRNAASAFSELDLLDSTEDSSTKSASVITHDAALSSATKGKNNQAKIQKSKAALAQISQLLDYEIDALEKKVTTKSVNVGGGSGLRAVFQSRGEEAPGVVGPGTIDPKYSKLAGAYVGSGSPTTPVPRTNTSDKEKASDYVEYSDYAEIYANGKRIPMTPKPATTAENKEVKARSTIYDEAVLDTDKATYDQYEEWIGDDKGSKEIINRRTNLKKGTQHDSETIAIPFRPKASRTTVQTGATVSPSSTTAAPSTEKQRKINFDHSDFLKEILTSDFSEYEDVTNAKKLDGDARISVTTPAPVRHVTTTTRPKVTPSRSDQLNKVHQLENLLGLPHQGLMDETLRPQTNPVVWATPSPQFRSEGGSSHRRKILKKKLNKAKATSRVDIDNPEVDKQVNMIDSDIHTFDGDAGVVPKQKAHQNRILHKKVLKNRAQFREQPPLLDNDDFSGVKGYSPYPSMRKPTNRGPPKNKALSIGVTGKRHRAIHDGYKAQAIIKSHKMLFSKRNNLRRYLLMSKINHAKPVTINDDTVRALDWMMQSLGATELLETPKRPVSKYQHARVNSHARAEISAGLHNAARKTSVVDSVAIGSPVQRPVPVHRPSKILPPRKKVVAFQSQPFTKVHDSDLLWSRPQEGISRMKPLRKSAHGIKHKQIQSTPLPMYPPDLRANPPKQKSLTPVLETQPLNLLPPPLDEALDQVRYPRNGAYGTGFELDGSSPDAAAYLAAEGTARPAKALPRRTDNRARGVKTVTGVERKALIGGAYTSTSAVAAFPSKFVDQKTPPRQPVAGLPEHYLKSKTTLLDNDMFTTTEPPSTGSKKDSNEKKPVPFVMHEGSMDERNTIAAEIERLEELVNNNKEHFNAPTFTDKGSELALPKEFEPLLSDPRLYEDALKEIKEENKALGISGTAVDALLSVNRSDSKSEATNKTSNAKKARWSSWGDWGECLCGQQLRTRACETDEGTQVSGCIGSSYEAQSCTGGSCPSH